MRKQRGRSSAPLKFPDRLRMIAFAAIGIRLIHVWFVVHAVDGAQILDAAYYHDLALVFLGKQQVPGLESSVGFTNLGYPRALELIYSVHASPTAVLVVQAASSGVTTLLVGDLARAISGRESIGLLAAGLFALYAPSIFYDGLLLVPCLSASLAALLGWSLYRATATHAWQFGALAGVSIGLSTLLRASQLFLFPFAIIALWTFRREPAGGRSQSGLLLALVIGAAVCVVPAVVSQRVTTGTWIPVTANGGMNFWIGNHRGATGTHVDAAFLGASKGGDFRHTLVLERDGFLEEARRRSRAPALSLAAANGFWWHEGWREMKSAPSESLLLLVKKAALAANDYELRTNASFELLEELSPILRWNPLRFGVVFVLAAFGVWELRGRKRRLGRWVSALLVVPAWLTCTLFFVSGEYRHSAAPALVILAACGLERCFAAARTGGTWGVLSAWRRSACVMGAALLALYPTPRMGAAKDRKAYAEALATPGADGSLPTRERYSLARALLQRHGESVEDRVLASEAGLLVESNQAIQFRDRNAALRLVSLASALWHTDLQPGAPFDALAIERIRRNSVRRAAQLCRQPFVSAWHDVREALAALGCHSWSEAHLLLERGALAQAELFLQRAEALAPRSAEVIAYRARLERLRASLAR